MPINRDLGHLPRAPQQEERGWAPDAHPRFGTALVDAWFAAEQARDNDRLARFRHSDAGACSRAIAYAALKVPESNPIDRAGVFITTQGQKVHEHWQEALRARYPEAEVELKVTHENEDGQRERGGHIDAVVRVPAVGPNGGPSLEEGTPLPVERVISIEGKTMGGYGYKRAIGIPPAARTPQGPSYSHVIQASLNAKARDADEAVVLYMTREAISIQAAQRAHIDEDRRIIAEWTLDRETYTRIADTEIERITGILALVDEGKLPRRKIPDPELPPGHRIENPRDGAWVDYDAAGIARDAGSTWHCAYCRWQDLCATHPTDRVAITEVALELEAST